MFIYRYCCYFSFVGIFVIVELLILLILFIYWYCCYCSFVDIIVTVHLLLLLLLFICWYDCYCSFVDIIAIVHVLILLLNKIINFAIIALLNRLVTQLLSFSLLRNHLWCAWIHRGVFALDSDHQYLSIAFVIGLWDWPKNWK